MRIISKAYTKNILLFSLVIVVLLCLINIIHNIRRINNNNGIVNATSDTIKNKPKNQIKFASPIYFSQDRVDHLIQDYNKSNKENIQVISLRIPYEEYQRNLNLLICSGEGPDIFEIESEWLGSFVKDGILADLSSYIEKEFLDQFPTWVIDSAKKEIYNGKLYTIQSSEVTCRLIYNKDLFEKTGLDSEAPPRTLKELENFAIKIGKSNVGQGKYGFALPLREDGSGFGLSMEVPATYSGSYFYDFEKQEYNLRPYKLWLKAFINIKKEGGLYPGETSLKYDMALTQFAEGNIGMLFAPNWVPAALERWYTMKCNWGIAMPPAIDERSEGKAALLASPGYFYGVNKKCRNIDKAAVVWKHLYSKEYTGELYKNGIIMPVINSIKNYEAYIPQMESVKAFSKTSKESLYPDTPLPIRENSRFKTYIDILQGVYSIDTGLDQESKRLNDLLDYYITR